MPEARYNSQDLWLLKSFHDEFVSRLVNRSDPQIAFWRQIDLWWYALGIGVSNNIRTPLPDRSNLVKFNDGGILESDPWRITHLELLALAEEDQAAATNAATVVQIANEYALTGCNILTNTLRGVMEPQLHLIALISSLNTNY